MASSFMGIYVQREALLVSQKALDITGNNVANIKTTGYTRQRVDTASVANTGGNLGYNTRVSLAGRGVEGVGVTQIRDALLDEKYRDYSGKLCSVGVKANVLSDLEDSLDDIEADDAGFSAILEKFKESLQAFSSDNADRNEIANVAIGAAKNVVQVLNDFSERIDTVGDNTLADTNTTVNRINSIFKEMAGLNEQIKDSYIQMGYISNNGSGYMVDNTYGPLELKDKMNLLIDELAEYGDIHVNEEHNGSFSVTFGGETVVHGDQYAQMAMKDSNDPALGEMGFLLTDSGTLDAATDKYSGLMNSDEWDAQITASGSLDDYIRDTNTGAIDITGTDANGDKYLTQGTLRGYLDMYNGNGLYADTANGGNNYQGVLYYKNMINALAKSFAEGFNEIYEDDFGFEVFTYGDDFNTAAENLRVSDAWLKNPELIARPQLIDEDAYGDIDDEYEELDNTYINKMLGVFTREHTYGNQETVTDPSDPTGATTITTGANEPLKYTFEDYVNYYGNKLGSQCEYEKNVVATTQIMTTSASNAREEVMGVSMEEEGVNMMTYQKWYNAIARMVTSLDQCLDKVINGMGICGMA